MLGDTWLMDGGEGDRLTVVVVVVNLRVGRRDVDRVTIPRV